MKTFAEYRAEAWRVTCKGHWAVKFMLLIVVIGTLSGLAQKLWGEAALSMGIQTWSMFFDAKAKAWASGLDLSVPSRAIALDMTKASAFEVFFNCIIQGIVAFGVCGFFLRAAKGDSGHWFSRTFAGFKRPLGLAWLYFRYVLQILLWSLLFVVPGIVAYYRYCQCWNLKVENPDWSAGKCLSESCRMMKGNKRRRFGLDMSYWIPITLLLLGILTMAVLALMTHLKALPVSGAAIGLLVFALSAVCLWGGIVLSAYMAIGQALFYLDLRGADAPDPATGAQS